MLQVLKNKKPTVSRDVRLDGVRVILMLLVIGIHSSMDALADLSLSKTALVSFLFICDGGFFALSGYFMLNKELHTGIEYLQFYLKRIITVIVPALLLHPTLDILFYRHVFSIGWKAYIHAYIENVLVNDFYSPLWFVYSYIALVLGAPFMAKLLNHLSKKELLILAAVTLCYQLTVDICDIKCWSFRFGGYWIGSWTMYFIGGFYLRKFREEIKKYRLVFYGLGLAAYVFIVHRLYTSNGILGPANMLQTSFYLTFILCAIVFIINQVAFEKVAWLSAGVTFLAKHSYTIYLTHSNIIGSTYEKTNKLLGMMHIAPDSGAGNLLSYVFNVVFAILFAVLYDEIFLFRIQDLLRHLLKPVLEKKIVKEETV